MRIWPGRPYPLGATWDGRGVNFAVYSENATEVELCLFATKNARREHARLRLREVTAHVWHGYVPGLGTRGNNFGFRNSSVLKCLHRNRSVDTRTTHLGKRRKKI